MSCRHRFLTTKDLNWKWFNALVLGMIKTGKDEKNELMAAIDFLKDIKKAALTYVANIGGWSNNIGLYFHIFGHNSVNSLHLHMLDMDAVGPTFWQLDYKNCPLDAVLKVLQEEIMTKQLSMLATELGDVICSCDFCQLLSDLGLTTSEAANLCEFLGQDETGAISIHRFVQWLMVDSEAKLKHT